MTDEPDLVALFYRADWTRLSLSAEVREITDRAHQRSRPVPRVPWIGDDSPLLDLPPREPRPEEYRARLRIAPGGRYQVDILAVGSPGEDRPDRDEVLRRRYGNGPDIPPPYPELLWPSSLLNAFSLELVERAELAGRATLRVVATPAPGVWRAAARDQRPERIEVIADAGTGILLRYEEFFEGRAVHLAQLSDARFGPDAGDLQELGDDAEDDAASHGNPWSSVFSGPGWEAARTAVNVAGTVLGFTAGHAPRGADAAPWETATTEDAPEAAIPPAGDRFDPAVSGGPASDEVLHALYRSGRAEFSATLHWWVDAELFGERARSWTSGRGLSGIGSAIGSAADWAGPGHQVTRVTVGGGGRYRIEHLSGNRKDHPRVIACDGSRRWRVFDDRVIVGPARPLDEPLTELVDTAVLLQTHVSDVAETEVSGRRGFALRALRSTGTADHTMAGRLRDADLVVDAELGIVLRLSEYEGDALLQRYEFRDVAPLSDDGSEFAFDIPPGVRVEHSDGGPLGELDLSPALRSALRTAESAAKAARGFLDALGNRRRLSRDRQAPGRESGPPPLRPVGERPATLPPTPRQLWLSRRSSAGKATVTSGYNDGMAVIWLSSAVAPLAAPENASVVKIPAVPRRRAALILLMPAGWHLALKRR
jgi:outer membrane lipoprotein-sorting protein